MHKFDTIDSYYTEEIQRLAKIGLWHLDMATNNYSVSEYFYDIYEASESVPPTLNEIYLCYEPDSRTVLVEKAMLARNEGLAYDVELILTTLKGNRRWIRMICKPNIVDGKVTELLGVLQDITEKKKN